MSVSDTNNTMSDCLSNLDKCNAGCCRTLAFNIPGYAPTQLIDYYLKHGCKIKKLKRDLIQIIVPCVCPQLDTETNLCKLHNTQDKPKLCINFNKNTADSGKYHIPQGCIYGN